MNGGSATTAAVRAQRFDDAAQHKFEDYRVAADRLVEGNPLQRAAILHSAADGKFVVGIWESEPGCWRVRYTEEEYCRILQGRCVLTSGDGTRLEVQPGDEFVIPRGFAGTWQVLEYTRKRFVIYESEVGG
ncbi:MAG: cupin domain-containing protein [Steroidobacteraceae bacterium]